jgi:hypothetical protein
MLYPDIPVQYTVPSPTWEQVDVMAMEQIPQWQGVRAILDTMEFKITAGVKTIYPPTQPCDEEVITNAARGVNVTVGDFSNLP